MARSVSGLICKDALRDTLNTTNVVQFRSMNRYHLRTGVASADAPYFKSDALERNRLAFPRASRAQRFIVERRAPRGRAVRQRIIEP